MNVGSGEFVGRVAFVTGAGSGIGASIAVALAEHGAAVTLADLRLDAATETARTISAAGGRALPVRVDVCEPASVDHAVDASLEEFGALHLAVNSAGVGGNADLIAEREVKDWQHILDVNLTGVFLCLRREIRAMTEAGGGTIVNVSSLAGRRACPGMSAYVAAKHGVAGLTSTAAMEYAHAGIRVNAVAPGPVDTPLLAGIDAATRAAWAAAHPLRRMATVVDVTAACLFLLSDRAAMISGIQHPVDGGLGVL